MFLKSDSPDIFNPFIYHVFIESMFLLCFSWKLFQWLIFIDKNERPYKQAYSLYDSILKKDKIGREEGEDLGTNS